MELLNEFLKAYNCHGIPAGNTNCQMGGWFRKQITKMDDLKGLKFRLGGFAGKIMQRVGVVPQQIAGGDIYPALEKGTIDGAEWVGPYDDEKLGFYKVAKFYHYPGWWEPSSCLMFVVNIEKWNSLPALYKEALTSACLEVNNWIATKYDASNTAALKRVVARARCCSRSRRRSWTAATRPPRSSMRRSTRRTRPSRRSTTATQPSWPTATCGTRSPTTPWTAT